MFFKHLLNNLKNYKNNSACLGGKLHKDNDEWSLSHMNKSILEQLQVSENKLLVHSKRIVFE
jgi:hypothetical protein